MRQRRRRGFHGGGELGFAAALELGVGALVEETQGRRAAYKGLGNRLWRAGHTEDVYSGRTRSRRRSPSQSLCEKGDDRWAPVVSLSGAAQAGKTGWQRLGPEGQLGCGAAHAQAGLRAGCWAARRLKQLRPAAPGWAAGLARLCGLGCCCWLLASLDGLG
jgi:hypothetical protein